MPTAWDDVGTITRFDGGVAAPLCRGASRDGDERRDYIFPPVLLLGV